MNKKVFLPFLCFLIIFFSSLIVLLAPSKLYPPKPADSAGRRKAPNSSTLPNLPRHSFFNLLEKDNSLTLLAVGDIMLGRYVNIQTQKSKDWRYPFLKTASVTSSADIAFGNLEAPFAQNCPATSTGMIFCAPPSAIEGLNYAGFDVLSLVNNHILNYGQKGLEQTRKFLSSSNILYSPLSSSKLSDPSDSSDSSNNLTIYQSNNLTFGFLSFDLVTYPQLSPLSQISLISPKVDILVVSLHWGVEYQPQPSLWQINLAHQIIDSGAKVIIGHHPHVTQPTESYHNGLIFYSLGNFVFDQPWSEQTKKGKIVKIVFEGKNIQSYEEIPIYIENNSQPVFLP